MLHSNLLTGGSVDSIVYMHMHFFSLSIVLMYFICWIRLARKIHHIHRTLHGDQSFKKIFGSTHGCLIFTIPF